MSDSTIRSRSRIKKEVMKEGACAKGGIAEGLLVENPKTKKMVKACGRVGKELLGLTKKLNRPRIYKDKKKDCASNQIYNEDTGKCVLRTGRVGQQILKKQGGGGAEKKKSVRRKRKKVKTPSPRRSRSVSSRASLSKRTRSPKVSSKLENIIKKIFKENDSDDKLTVKTVRRLVFDRIKPCNEYFDKKEMDRIIEHLFINYEPSISSRKSSPKSLPKRSSPPLVYKKSISKARPRARSLSPKARQRSSPKARRRSSPNPRRPRSRSRSRSRSILKAPPNTRRSRSNSRSREKAPNIKELTPPEAKKTILKTSVLSFFNTGEYCEPVFDDFVLNIDELESVLGKNFVFFDENSLYLSPRVMIDSIEKNNSSEDREVVTKLLKILENYEPFKEALRESFIEFNENILKVNVDDLLNVPSINKDKSDSLTPKILINLIKH
jgi:hypothetical protein